MCSASFYFQRFLQRFIDPTSTEDENAGLDLNEPLYMQKLEEVEYLFICLFHCGPPSRLMLCDVCKLVLFLCIVYRN